MESLNAPLPRQVPPNARPLTVWDMGLGFMTLVAWSSAFPLVQMALRSGVAPLPLASLRYGLACLIVMPFVVSRLARNGQTALRLPPASAWPRYLLCGFLGITLYNVCLNLGEETVSPATASLIGASSPVICGLLGAWLHRDHLSRFGWAGSALAFAGVLLVCAAQGPLGFGSGTFVLMLAALGNALFNILQVPLVRRYGPGISLCCFIIAGAGFLLPWLPQGIATLLKSPPRTWAILLALAAIPGVFGYGCWARLLGRIGAARASLILYGVPPCAIVLTLLLEGSWPNAATLLGGAVVLAGLALTRLGSRKPAPDPEISVPPEI
ncbi:DMT family transporter [Oecophyllibacter saccharovorans]|uniref:DMT family transporter n=1 Tax=Oecophyllibacter saccharovorans TaxID=2558360 RepID=UPI00116D899E|nr:DMT family transporter [Oecophyllibacter saccharovorans]TPW36568.1 DMT family transporter [Oecophyllibacter saccharovorans]